MVAGPAMNLVAERSNMSDPFSRRMAGEAVDEQEIDVAAQITVTAGS